VILGVLCVLGFGFAWALGADPRQLAAVRLRWSGLVLAALLLQLLVFVPSLDPSRLVASATAVHVTSYVLLIACGLRNLRLPGFALAAAGLASNTLAIFVNGGHMPVSVAAWRAVGRPLPELTATGVSNNTGLLTPSTHLSFLGDVFALPGWLPLANTFSVGDVLLVTGAVLFVYRQGRRERDRTLVRTLEPLRSRDFRVLLAGRTISKLGDWVSLAALVTWIFARTHSTLGVSLVLLARLTASVAGGVAASSRLDRWDRFVVLRGVEALRAVATASAIGLVALGRPYLVAICVFASYFLASATDPVASSAVADVLPDDARNAGNALHALGRAAVMAAGSVAGGLLATRIGVLPALAADVGTFALALAVYTRSVGRVPPLPALQPAGRPLARAEVLAAIGGSRAVRALVGSFAVATLAMGLLNASLPAFLAARAPHAGGYGVAMGAIAIGLMCGELLSGRVGESVAARTPALAFAVAACVLAVTATSGLATTILLFLFLLGVADGATETAYDTIVQRETPAAVRAGVFALGGALQQMAMGAGFVLAAVLPHAPAGVALTASAIALGAAAAVGLGVAVAGRTPAGRAGPYPGAGGAVSPYATAKLD
jgi:Family of unknown function (DUF5317)/Major Facilitator Superfamily